MGLTRADDVRDRPFNDVAELKQYAIGHARAQNIPGYREVLAAVRTDDGDAPGSWTGEWLRAGDRLRERGKLLAAVRQYTMARFPYIDSPARQLAHERTVETFTVWAGGQGFAPLEVPLGDQARVRCWTTGLEPGGTRPLVLVCGGIVSAKEQWAPSLALVRRFGMAGVALEMPGVGENTLPYDEGSWQLVSRVLDAVVGQADVRRTCALMLSFSGNLALRCAIEDPRITSIITAGAPVHSFFTESLRAGAVPRITCATLAHLARTTPAELPGALCGLAITAAQLSVVDIPVACMVSGRDEIIPAADPRLLHTALRHSELLTHDDVHGSPDHTTETRLWTARRIVRFNGGHAAQGALLELLFRLARLRSWPPIRQITGAVRG